MKSLAASRIDKALRIPGWMNEAELKWLAVSASDCRLIVEFGSYHGRSTRALCDNTDGVVWAVDPWGGKYQLEDGRDVTDVNTYVLPYFSINLKDHIDSGRLTPIRGYSRSFKLDVKVDMVFLDGDHRYANVIEDIEIARKLLKPQGLLCGHDYNHPEWPGVKQAVDEQLPESQVIEGGTIWWTRKF